MCRSSERQAIFVNDAIKWAKVSFQNIWSDWGSFLYSYEHSLAGGWLLVLRTFMEFCKSDAFDNSWINGYILSSHFPQNTWVHFRDSYLKLALIIRYTSHLLNTVKFLKKLQLCVVDVVSSWKHRIAVLAMGHTSSSLLFTWICPLCSSQSSLVLCVSTVCWVVYWSHSRWNRELRF